MVNKEQGIIQAIGKHIIAQDALACRNKGIRVDESAYAGVVITGLEVVERGLSILGLTVMPDYALDTHTKPYGFRVGTLVAERFSILGLAVDLFCPQKGTFDSFQGDEWVTSVSWD